MLDNLNLKSLTALYNRLSEGKEIKKFTDHKAALRRTAARAAELNLNDADLARIIDGGPITPSAGLRIVENTYRPASEFTAAVLGELGFEPGLAEKVAAFIAKQAGKPIKSAKAAGPRAMTDSQAKLVALCERAGGANAKELASAVGWPSIAARTTLSKLAVRFGYTLTEAKEKGRGIVFHLAATKAAKVA